MNQKQKHLTLVDIKDVDLSKLEDDERYFVITSIGQKDQYWGSSIKGGLYKKYITAIYLPSSLPDNTIVSDEEKPDVNSVVKDGFEEVRTKIYELLHCDIDSKSDMREQTNKVMDIFSEYRKLQPQDLKGLITQAHMAGQKNSQQPAVFDPSFSEAFAYYNNLFLVHEKQKGAIQ